MTNIIPTKKRINFTPLRDHFRAAALTGAVMAPYTASMVLQKGTEILPQQAALIAGVFLALRLPYVRQVPLFLTRAIIIPLVLRGRETAPENMQKMLQELQDEADSTRKVTLRTYERGMTNNAAAFGTEIYVGKKLVDTMDDKAMKFIIGHELAHIESEDISERYLFWPPYIDSIVMGMGTVMTAWSSLAAGANPAQMAMYAGMTVACYGYYKFAKGMRDYHSRVTEYRADANALRMTKDLPAAIRGLTQLHLNAGRSVTKEPTRWETFNASHPIGRDRIRALEEVARTLPSAAP